MYLGEEPAGWSSQCGKEPSLPVYELVVDSLQFWGWMSRGWWGTALEEGVELNTVAKAVGGKGGLKGRLLGRLCHCQLVQRPGLGGALGTWLHQLPGKEELGPALVGLDGQEGAQREDRHRGAE